MCLAVPMKLIEKKDADYGIVESGEVKSRVNLQLLEDVKVGDYLIVHAGFAIQRLNKDEAEKTLRIFEEMSYEIR
jgi:hydrogenase expression/formation protein HypC